MVAVVHVFVEKLVVVEEVVKVIAVVTEWAEKLINC